VVAGTAHLCEDLVQPLQGAVEVDLYPAGSRGHVLSVVLGPPALHEGHADGAHLGELVHGLEPVVDGLGQQRGELLVVEDLQAAAGRDLADGGRVEAVVVVAVPGLDKDGRVGETLGVHLASDVVKMDTFANMSSGVLDGRVSVYIGQLAKAKSVIIFI